MSLLYVCFLTTFLSGVANLSAPSLGYIFRRAGGVCTLGIRDLISAEEGETGPDDPAPPLDEIGDLPGTLRDPGFFLCIPGLNCGIRLFLSVAGEWDRARGDETRLIPRGGVDGCGGGVPMFRPGVGLRGLFLGLST